MRSARNFTKRPAFYHPSAPRLGRLRSGRHPEGTVRDETVTYNADGVTLMSRLFYEEHGGPRPAVLVFPEAFGLGNHAVSRAQRLAEMGFVSLACDIHGNALLLNGLEEAVGLLQPLYDDRKRMRARGLAALELLTRRKEVDARRI